MTKKNEELISIIVSVYNGEKYLEECIDSILNQTYKTIELILVNDGSIDNSDSIIKKYLEKDARIKYINQTNSGVSASRNRALDIAEGEYICIMDQDDCISNDYVEYLYKIIKENNAEISMSINVDKFYKNYNEYTIKDKIEIWNGHRAVIEMLYHKFVIAPWNKMISKKIIDDNKIKFNKDYFNGEGFAFSIECFQFAKRVVVTERKIYHYRVGNPKSGASKFKVSSIESSINAQQYIKNKLIYDDKKIINAWNFSNWHTYCDNFNIIVGCGAKKKYRELYLKIKRECKKNAFIAVTAPVSFQQKIRGILFKINPDIAAKIINKFRIRKFEKID